MDIFFRSGEVMRFAEVLEAADHLSTDEQMELVEVLRKRIVEQRRKEIAQDIREARKEFAAGRSQPATPDEILREILG
jgi:16S rRNA C1402 N4-methylase RsmH